MRRTTVIKIILAALVIIDAVIMYACCVVAGRADEEVPRMEVKKGDRDYEGRTDHSTGS